MAGGWRLPPLRCEWCAWARRQPPPGWWAVCCVGRAQGVTGRSPWDETSASVWAVSSSSGRACGGGGRCGTRRGSRQGTCPVSVVFFRKAAAFRAPSAEGAYIFVRISGLWMQRTHARAAVSVVLTSPRERESARAPQHSLPESHAAVRQGAAARVRDDEGRVRLPQTLHDSQKPSTLPLHPQSSCSLPFKNDPGDHLLCRALRL